ncbi:hypothetical protein MUBE_14270 [Mycobacterium uberis]|uniref:Uncharacterized protein n=1 Tax=Mycobacterium uberis TaxID=2162698 RepID=A0A3E1HCG3_9MYCO|nr:hypothetical protein MUBE_14270 [Mycobacterium uberis]
MATPCSAFISVRTWSPRSPQTNTAVPIGTLTADDRGDQQAVHTGELVGVALYQHDRSTKCWSSRELDTDPAAADQNYHRSGARVIHDCDYCLR